MKLCLCCHHQFAAGDWGCPACGTAPLSVAGFPSFARPEGGDGFQPEFFSELAELESGHFWFQGRNHLILWALGRYFPSAHSLLEVGCGTGYVLSGIASEFSHMRIAGSDYFAEGLPFAASRVPRAELIQADARQLPFHEEFDVVGAFDVLEHIAEDEDVLRQIHRVVRPGGGVLLTVPQHLWLWSQVDVEACHVRRYTAGELREKIEAAGFRVELMTSFISLLLPALLFSRRRRRSVDSADLCAGLHIGRITNALCAVIFSLECGLIRKGLKFPAGGSLFLTASKV